MTGNGAKIWTGNQKSPVKVRRRNAKILDFRRISECCGLSGICVGRDEGQNCRNRGHVYGIIECMGVGAPIRRLNGKSRLKYLRDIRFAIIPRRSLLVKKMTIRKTVESGGS